MIMLPIQKLGHNMVMLSLHNMVMLPSYQFMIYAQIDECLGSFGCAIPQSKAMYYVLSFIITEIDRVNRLTIVENSGK